MKNINLLILLVATCSISLVGFAADNFVTPRTEWGQPDLQGVWNFSSNTPMQRPQRFGERQFLTAEEAAEARAQQVAADAASDAAIPNAGVDASYNDFWVESAGIGNDMRTSLITYPADGRIPERREGVAVAFPGVGPSVSGERPVRFIVGGIGTDGPEDRGLSERCLVGFNAGPPFTPSLYNNNVQIFQSRDHAVIMTEMIHDARIVPISPADAQNNSPPIDESIGLWSGDSRGHWDGDTLVVVTRNFNGLTQSFSAFGNSADKVLTERFTRVGPYTIVYEFTVDDPSTFTDKFTAIVPMTKVGGQLYEYACHEGNYGMLNILRGARTEESLAN
ncbi:MAG: hypothetical protein QGG67_11600 [Gammaproteobacteria bacterium]|jgi:hypothetical protein|nr:hypothetical protein [Gammaproteobacteria bacterium]MBQ15154.1 hypothetical protein [Gammaproteobacteria bacterium]MDP6096606.1 hypothetical protein [Gammaproteobacteria bacterium]HJO11432.1 hypothetical protein [Gammaproteobacteria bacterium]